MRYFIYLLFVFFIFTSCNNGDSCFSKPGNSISKTLVLPPFDAVDIPKGITVEIIESTESKIEISSKENYLSNLDFKVADKKLKISNSTSCSLLSSYQVATVRIYTPTLNTIVSNTQFKVVSVGTLHFPELKIITSTDDKSASSYFDLNIDNSILRIEDSQVGFFKITGKTIWLDIALYGGTGRIEAQNLKAYDCTFFQRSNNDILVHIENELKGTIYSVGNLIVFNKPKIVQVEQKYKGKLIYK